MHRRVSSAKAQSATENSAARIANVNPEFILQAADGGKLPSGLRLPLFTFSGAMHMIW